MTSPLGKVMAQLTHTTDDIANFSSISLDDINFTPRWPALALGAFMILGAVGNTLVCIAICVDRKLQNVTNYFLFSLAAADLLVSLLVMPFSILIELNHGYWLHGSLLCASYVYVDVFLCSASIVHMSIISIDRYLGISRPLKPRNKSKFVVTLKIIAVWVITTLISCPIIVLAIVNPRDIYQDYSCAIDNPYYMIYGSTLAFLIPSLIMAATYVRTTQLLRQELITCGNAIGGNRGPRGSTHADSGEGLRRTHIRHRSLRNQIQERQRTFDSMDDNLQGSRSGLGSPNLASTSRRFSYHNNNNDIKMKSTRKCTPATRDTDMTGAAGPRPAGNGLKTRPTAPPRAPSEESQEISFADCAMQTEDNSASASVETFRSRFRERTMTLWNKTTRRATSASELANERKATRVLGLVFVCFCICWTPFFVHNFTLAFCRNSCQIPRWIASVFLWLGYISSTINPIIYTVFNERFRNAFLNILTCRCPRRPPVRQEQFSRTSGGGSFQTSATAANYGLMAACSYAYAAKHTQVDENKLIST